MKECTQVRHQGSLARLNSDLATLAPDFYSQDEESRDWILADWVLDEMEAGHGRAQVGLALSALCKSDPRANYKVAWKTFSIWGQHQPPKQAAVAPMELVWSMFVVALCLQKHVLGFAILLCYVGLLRVREAFGLTWENFMVTESCVVLFLGLTNRGSSRKSPSQHLLCVNFAAGTRLASMRLSSRPSRWWSVVALDLLRTIVSVDGWEEQSAQSYSMVVYNIQPLCLHTSTDSAVVELRIGIHEKLVEWM